MSTTTAALQAKGAGRRVTRREHLLGQAPPPPDVRRTSPATSRAHLGVPGRRRGVGDQRGLRGPRGAVLLPRGPWGEAACRPQRPCWYRSQARTTCGSASSANGGMRKVTAASSAAVPPEDAGSRGGRRRGAAHRLSPCAAARERSPPPLARRPRASYTRAPTQAGQGGGHGAEAGAARAAPPSSLATEAAAAARRPRGAARTPCCGPAATAGGAGCRARGALSRRAGPLPIAQRTQPGPSDWALPVVRGAGPVEAVTRLEAAVGPPAPSAGRSASAGRPCGGRSGPWRPPRRPCHAARHNPTSQQPRPRPRHCRG